MKCTWSETCLHSRFPLCVREKEKGGDLQQLNHKHYDERPQRNLPQCPIRIPRRHIAQHDRVDVGTEERVVREDEKHDQQHILGAGGAILVLFRVVVQHPATRGFQSRTIWNVMMSAQGLGFSV